MDLSTQTYSLTAAVRGFSRGHHGDRAAGPEMRKEEAEEERDENVTKPSESEKRTATSARA